MSILDVKPRARARPRVSFLRRAALRLGPEELRRRVWHIAPGFLPFVLWPISHRDPISPTLMAILVVVAIGIGGAIFAKYRLIKRRGESNQRLAACAGYVASVLLTAILFPAHAELAMTVLAIMAFGDGMATVGGIVIGRRRLPWNHGKSIAGFVCFLIFGTLMSALVYWGESHNLEALPQTVPVTWPMAIVIGGGATLVAAIAESLPSRINDNIRVGFTAALSLACLQTLIGGWS